MSYLSNDPLSKDEESAIVNAEFDDMIDTNPPKKLTNLHPLVYYPSNFVPKYSTYVDRLHTVPIKIDLRRKPRSNFVIDMDTYRHILQTLASRHGDKTPVNNQFECLSISFVTKPHSNLCLYYKPKDDPNNRFYLIAKVRNQSRPHSFTIPCPFTDSYLAMKYNDAPPDGYNFLRFHWLYNSSVGRNTPHIYKSKFLIPESNGLVPWLSYSMWGDFLITGIIDHITFNISFILDSHARVEGPRQQAIRTLKQLKARQNMHFTHLDRTVHVTEPGQGEIYWDEPSQLIEWHSDEDPLLDAFK